MTTKRSGMIMALLAVSILSVPVMFADAIEDYLDLDSAKELKVKVTSDSVKELKIKLDSSIPVDGGDGAFGYGVFSSNGQLLVATTHGGVYDSESQTAPILDSIKFSDKAQICDEADPGCEPVWHSHSVKITTTESCVDEINNPLGKAVDQISWQEPADKTEIKGKNNSELKIKDSPLKRIKLIDSLSNEERNFNFKNYNGGAVVSFNIDIRDAVCLDNIVVVGPIPLDHKEYKLKN